VVDVIAPVSIGTELRRFCLKPQNIAFGGLNVKRPYYFSIPQRFPLLNKFIYQINNWLFGLSLFVSFKSKKYDFIYCHFLQSAIPVIHWLPFNNIPLLVNIGESNPSDYEIYFSKKRLSFYLNKINYIVTVSKLNYDYILSLDSNLSERTEYIPNGVDINHFKPYDKIYARNKLGLDLNTKYIVFIGHFIERKGPKRVLEAIKDTNIKGIFLGSNGPDSPEGNEVAVVGPVSNKDIVFYLSAADAFVLPSLHEGMSNAILEAMACCTPLVVSNLRFNTDFISSDCAIFVDPNNVQSIKEGIIAALNEGNNRCMRSSLSLIRENISIETRIKKVFKFVLES
jgi:glycosyltransferase involved in cell wall biosynthesis